MPPPPLPHQPPEHLRCRRRPFRSHNVSARMHRERVRASRIAQTDARITRAARANAQFHMGRLIITGANQGPTYN